MKAISIRQPWAWLIVEGVKPVENRSWATRYRGPLLIHAAKTFDLEGYRWIALNFPELELPHRMSFQRGGIVGQVRLVECVEQHPSAFFFGPHGFVFEDAERLPFRELRGELGLFEVA